MKIPEVLSNQIKGLQLSCSEAIPASIHGVLGARDLQVRRGRGALTGTGLFGFGVIVSGVAAALPAPKSGLELRADLQDKLDANKDRSNAIMHS